MSFGVGGPGGFGNNLIDKWDWQWELEKKRIAPIRGTATTPTPQTQSSPICGRNIDTSVVVGTNDGVPIGPNTVTKLNLSQNPNPSQPPAFQTAPHNQANNGIFDYIGSGSGAFDAYTSFIISDPVPGDLGIDPPWLDVLRIYKVPSGASFNPLTDPGSAVQDINGRSDGSYSLVRIPGNVAGQAYDIYMAYIDHSGQPSAAVLIGTTASNPIVIQPGNGAPVPSGFTWSASASGQAYSAGGGATYDCTFNLNLSISNYGTGNPPLSSWLYQIGIFVSLTGKNNFTQVTQIPPPGGTVVNGIDITGLGAGNAYDVKVRLYSFNSNSYTDSGVVFTTQAQYVGPGGISPSGPNLVVDSNFDHVTSGNPANFTGSNDPYWNFYLIDGASFYIGAGGVSTSSGIANYLGIRPGDGGKTCMAQSETIPVGANQLYGISGYINATHCSGGNQASIQIVSTDGNTVYLNVPQTNGTNGIVSDTWTCPGDGSVTQVTFRFSSNNVAISGGNLVFAAPQLQMGPPGPYQPGPSVPIAAPTNPPTGGNGSGPGDPKTSPGHIKHPVHSPQTRDTIDDDSDVNGSYFHAGQLSGRHFYGGNTSDTGGMVDSSSNLLFTRHASPVTNTLSSSAGGDGSYLNSGKIFGRHISGMGSTDTTALGDSNGRFLHPRHSAQTQSAILATAGGEGSYVASSQLSARHFYGGNSSDSTAMVDSSSNLLFTRHASPVTNTLASSADTYGSYVKTGVIHAGVLYQPGSIGSHNYVFNPTFANGFTGWSHDNNGTWSTEGYGLGRLHLAQLNTTSNPICQQLIPGLASGQPMVAQCIIEIGQAALAAGNTVALRIQDGGGVFVAQSSGVTSSNGTGRFFQSVAFTVPSDGEVYVQACLLGNGAGSVSTSDIIWSKFQVEYGSKPTQWADHYSSSLVTRTHSPTAGGDGSYLATGLIYARHIFGLDGSTNAIGDGSGKIKHGYHSTQVQNVIDSSSNILSTMFPGSHVNQNGYLSNADGAQYRTQFINTSGCTITVKAQIAKANAASDAGFVFGTTTNGYRFVMDGVNNLVYLYKYDSVHGNATLGSTYAYTNDTNAHSYELTLTNNGNGTYTIEGVWDGHTFGPVTDSSPPGMTNPLPLLIFTGGQSGTVSDFFAKNGPNTYSSIHNSIRARILSDSTLHVDSGVGPVVGNLPYVNHHISLQTGIFKKNLVVNGNNCNGTGAVVPSSYGWTGTLGSVISLTSGGLYGPYGSVAMMELQSNPNGGYYQDIPCTPNQTYTFCAVVGANTANADPGIWIGSADGNWIQYNGSVTTPVGSLGTFYTNSTTQQINSWQYGNGATTGAQVCLYGTFTVPNGGSGNAPINKMRVMLYNADNIGVALTCTYAGVMVIEGNRLQDYIDHEPNASGIHLDRHIVDGTNFRRTASSEMSGNAIMRLNDGTYIRHVASIASVLSDTAGTDGLYLNTGVIARRHSVNDLGHNILYGTSFYNDVSQWTIFGTPGGTLAFVPDVYAGGRCVIERTNSTGTSDYLAYQVFTSAGGNITVSGFVETDAGGNGWNLGGGAGAWVDLFDVTSSTVLVSSPAVATNGSGQTYFTITANTTAGHSHQVRLRTQIATGNIFFYKIKAEYGSVATAWDDPIVASGFSRTFDINGNVFKSTAWNNQGSMPPVGIPGVSASGSYPSGGSPTVTISWSAGTLYTPDGTAVTINSGSWSQNGLSTSTTYHYGVYADINGGVHILGNYGANTAPSAQQKFAVYQDGRIPISEDCYGSTPATVGGSGGGGGGGGGSCPAVWQLVETLERGKIRADELQVGMHIRGPGGWVEIVSLQKLPAEIWRYTLTNGTIQESFDVNDTHALMDEGGTWVKTCELFAGQRLQGRDQILTVVEAKYLCDDFYMSMEVKGHLYYMGWALVHNPITL